MRSCHRKYSERIWGEAIKEHTRHFQRSGVYNPSLSLLRPQFHAHGPGAEDAVASLAYFLKINFTRLSPRFSRIEVRPVLALAKRTSQAGGEWDPPPLVVWAHVCSLARPPVRSRMRFFHFFFLPLSRQRSDGRSLNPLSAREVSRDRKTWKDN